MSSVVISGNTSGSVTLNAPDVAGSTFIDLPNQSGTVALGYQTRLITDSTNILLNNFATPSYNNVGSPFSVNIPANGAIRIASIEGRLLNNATATSHQAVLGIRIGTTNYWFGYNDTNGTISVNPSFNGGATASTYKEWKGNANGVGLLIGVSSYAVPSGVQTVQLIAAFDITQSTLQGATTQTRVMLEFIG